MNRSHKTTPTQRAEAVANIASGRETRALAANRLGVTVGAVALWLKSAKNGATKAIKKPGPTPGSKRGTPKMRAFLEVTKAIAGLTDNERQDVLSAAQVLFQ